ncbi:MAG TPA: tripartite tricarboxylate transporter substrate binding protein, partial [Burkholderiales bacterium]|nr:tripartite tricarboxylate transporter substrate binding protein [Burkholderiales bacterium]
MPFPPGSASDLIARVLADKMGAKFSAGVIVDNRPGAGGTIATAEMLKSPRDGYTIMTGTMGTHAIAPSLYHNLSFDPLKDLLPISIVAEVPLMVVATRELPANSMAELVKLAKEKPGYYTYASPGNGTLNHLMGELFKQTAKIDMPHIPYKGGALAYPDMIAGRVTIMFDPIVAGIAQVRAGKLKALAVAAPQRSAIAPEVPTMAEAGFPGLDSTLWIAVFAGAGTPADLVARLNGEINAVIQAPEVREKFAAQGALPVGTSPAQANARFHADTARWAKVIKDAG